MHLIGIEDQTFDFAVEPISTNVFCNGHNIGTVDRYSNGDSHTWRFWYGGRFYQDHASLDEGVAALKRMHVERVLTKAAVASIGQYVAEQSAKLFGEEQ